MLIVLAFAQRLDRTQAERAIDVESEGARKQARAAFETRVATAFGHWVDQRRVAGFLTRFRSSQKEDQARRRSERRGKRGDAAAEEKGGGAAHAHDRWSRIA